MLEVVFVCLSECGKVDEFSYGEGNSKRNKNLQYVFNTNSNYSGVFASTIPGFASSSKV
jgi:hypothetical protein